MKSALGLTLAIFLLITLAYAQQKGAAASAAGKKIYVSTCAQCHGPDGKGNSTGRAMGVKDLHSAEVVKMTDAQMKQVINNGKGNMPPWRGQLSEAQISDVATFVRSMQKGTAK